MPALRGKGGGRYRTPAVKFSKSVNEALHVYRSGQLTFKQGAEWILGEVLYVRTARKSCEHSGRIHRVAGHVIDQANSCVQSSSFS